MKKAYNHRTACKGPGTVSQRLDDVDVAKGLGMVLVVFGHIVARQPSFDNFWYIAAKDAVYRFHMAFFMFLGGIIFFLKVRNIRILREYGGQFCKYFLYFALGGLAVHHWVVYSKLVRRAWIPAMTAFIVLLVMKQLHGVGWLDRITS